MRRLRSTARNIPRCILILARLIWKLLILARLKRASATRLASHAFFSSSTRSTTGHPITTRKAILCLQRCPSTWRPWSTTQLQRTRRSWKLFGFRARARIQQTLKISEEPSVTKAWAKFRVSLEHISHSSALRDTCSQSLLYSSKVLHVSSN